MVSNLKSALLQSLMGELPSLEQREASATTATERRRWQVLVLIASGKTRRETSAITGCSLRTIQQIVQRYRRDGVAGLLDGRQQSPASTLLTDAQQQALRAALQHPPEDGGAWTGPKVAQWMTTATGKQVHRQRGWEYLQRLRANDVDTDETPALTSSGDESAECSTSLEKGLERKVNCGRDSLRLDDRRRHISALYGA